MAGHRARVGIALAGVAGIVIGVALSGVLPQAIAAQSAQARRAIRPEKSPNTGLPYSPGIMVGSTLYVSGHLGRDPVTAKLVTGGIEADFTNEDGGTPTDRLMAIWGRTTDIEYLYSVEVDAKGAILAEGRRRARGPLTARWRTHRNSHR